MRSFFLLPAVLFFVPVNSLSAQHLQVKNHSFGFRMHGVEEIGGNPTTIGQFLKRPSLYQRYVSSLPYNSIGSGGLAMQQVPTLYLTTELWKPSSTSRFWREHSLQVGMLLSNRLVKDGMDLSKEEFITTDNGFILKNARYSITQEIRFMGATVGINRRIHLANRLHFVAGLQGQGSVAAVHRYQQRWDSTTAVFQTGQVQPTSRQAKTTRLRDLPGKNFFQWQAMAPLGLEAAVYRQRLFVRLEAALGVVGSQFRPKDLGAREAHGVGVWLTYQPQ